MATIGQELSSPEEGWRRYDDTCIPLTKAGNILQEASSLYYGGSAIYYSKLNEYISFKFYGTKLRIISVRNANRLIDNSKLTIDGIDYIYSEYSASSNTQILLFEKLNLDNKIHEVKLSPISEGFVSLDAIDIDSDGYLVHQSLNEKATLESMEIGDIISCMYTAPIGGETGYFSELGACNSEYINPQISSTIPNGKFYFIKVDDNKYIADRNVQHSIAWESLNRTNIIDGTHYIAKRSFPNYNSDDPEISKLYYSTAYNTNGYHAFFGIGSHTFVSTSNDQYVGYVPTNPFKLKYFRTYYIDKVKRSYVTNLKIEIKTVTNPSSFVAVFDGAVNYNDIFETANGKEELITEVKVTVTGYSNTEWRSLRVELFEDVYKNLNITVPTGGAAYNELTSEIPIMSSNENDTCIVSTSTNWDNISYFSYNMFKGSIANITSDSWASAKDVAPPHNVIIQFKKPTNINQFKFTNRYNTVTSDVAPPKNIEIVASNDNVNWVTLATYLNTNTASLGVWCVNFNNNALYTYYKINIVSQYNSSCCCVGRVDVFNNNSKSKYSLTHQNQGGWPTTNDWDTHIWKGDLGGKISPSDDLIWNYKNIASISKENQIQGVKQTEGTVPSISAGSSLICTRGYIDSQINDNTAKRKQVMDSKQLGPTRGFRPMLITGGDN